MFSVKSLSLNINVVNSPVSHKNSLNRVKSLLIFYVVILIIKKIYKGGIQDEFAGKWYFLLIISAMSIASEYILSIDKGIAYITVIEISFIILLINVILYFFLQSFHYFFLKPRYVWLWNSKDVCHFLCGDKNTLFHSCDLLPYFSLSIR